MRCACRAPYRQAEAKREQQDDDSGYLVGGYHSAKNGGNDFGRASGQKAPTPFYAGDCFDLYDGGGACLLEQPRLAASARTTGGIQ
uniref:Uncharacterized protein n=1 Tax=mine drainage metagenome TaxID=410659 RepID=E6QWT8_9ZZZZ